MNPAIGPIYQIIVRDLVDQISGGSLRSGDRLESESRLAERYGVSRMTVRQALGELESSGHVVRRHGAGTFVSTPRPIQRRGNQLGAFHEEMGLDPDEIETQLMIQEVVTPPGAVADDLHLSPGQTTSHIVRLRKLHGVPIALQESWVPYLLAPGIARGGLVDGSLYKTMKERGNMEIRTAEQSVSATVASIDVAEALEVLIGSPVMSIRRVSLDASGNPVEVAQSYTSSSLPMIVRLER